MTDNKIFAQKVIYEKVYPHENLEEYKNITDIETYPINKYVSFEEFLNKLSADIEYVPLPERSETAELFKKTAIEISDIYELDIKIVQHQGHISVDYYFNSAGCMGFLKDILCMADDITFFANIKGYEIVMSVDYYTHTVYQHGKRIAP